MRWFVFLLAAMPLCAAAVRGTVVDPSDTPIAGAQVALMNRLGVAARATTDERGAFRLDAPAAEGGRIVVTAPGFATLSLPVQPELSVRLAIAPQVDSVRVVGSVLDAPLSEQGGSASLVPREEIRERNEPFALDLLRYLPGVAVTQNGPRGAASSVSIRGGDARFNLVQINGVPVNGFGGAFDFAHLPAHGLDRIEVLRGAQSAIYGSYANTGVVNFVTRSAEEGPNLEVLAEGGSHHQRRFAISGAAVVRGLGVTASASRLDSDGPVANSDYSNQGLAAHVTRGGLALSGFFNSNDVGAPGPWGSDPLRLFPGLDRIARNKNDFGAFSARYQADLAPRLRTELFGAYFQNQSFYGHPFGDSLNKDRRALAEARAVVAAAEPYSTAFGFAFTREDVHNTWITDDAFRSFPLQRNQEGVYWENRFAWRRLFANAGARAEIIHTPSVRPSAIFGRPAFARHGMVKVNPKLAAAYLLGATRLHASFGTGIRPPSGLEMAFTNNPALKPERTLSLDFGLEQRVLDNRLSLEGTAFYNRFTDLIVTLSPAMARLSTYRSDNLANSRAQGVELAARLRPTRHVWVTGSYTWLQSEILSLEGSSGLAPAFFRVGQELLRRPRHSGTLVSSFSFGRVIANLTGYFRSDLLDVEPNEGAGRGLFRNSGHANVGFNLNVRLAAGLTAYGHLRNALNQRYEEIYGYPSPLLNFVAGVKWSLR